ncbi:TIGR03086 family metal-binding protein [Amycolatopsis minnesotensis]|uniref:TIGR03086 family metal-binding protein n=2 Tax=Amycolatopsis minnesotensis TaxID=337894 RepID=A0ABN2PZ13_9PSEU
MNNAFEGIIPRFVAASTGFDRLLAAVRPAQWDAPTPCAEWKVRDLVNHMTSGNRNYVSLVDGGTAAGYLAGRDADALGADPIGAFRGSVRDCADAFARPGALARVLDYPLGRVVGSQALAVRTADSIVHTWDLARAIGVDDTLDAGLLGWLDDGFDRIYAGLAETPAAADTTHRFFAPPTGSPGFTRQDRLLRRMGREPSLR